MNYFKDFKFVLFYMINLKFYTIWWKKTIEKGKCKIYTLSIEVSKLSFHILKIIQ